MDWIRRWVQAALMVGVLLTPLCPAFAGTMHQQMPEMGMTHMSNMEMPCCDMHAAPDRTADRVVISAEAQFRLPTAIIPAAAFSPTTAPIFSKSVSVPTVLPQTFNRRSRSQRE